MIDEYWNEYYSSAVKTVPPSCFAKYVASEFSHYKNIIDIGCGNGRDSFYFSSKNFHVVGIDKSETAINICANIREENSLKNCVFYSGDVSSLDIGNVIDGNRFEHSSTIIYARFFLHAIGESDENAFLLSASRVVNKGSLLCLEFRTLEDEHLLKIERDHYRRFIDPADIMRKCGLLGMKLRSSEVGTGLAAYKHEDPVVARLVFG